MMLIRTGKPRSCQTPEGRGGQVIKEKEEGIKAVCCGLKMKTQMWVGKRVRKLEQPC